jgi:ABC-type Fe3+-siderophore transport system permease subunit
MGLFEEIENELEQSRSSFNSGCMGFVYLITSLLASYILWSLVYAGNKEWPIITVAIICSIIALILFYKIVIKYFI